MFQQQFERMCELPPWGTEQDAATAASAHDLWQQQGNPYAEDRPPSSTDGTADPLLLVGFGC